MKPLVIFVVLVAGVLFIVLSDPPKSLCDTQIESFRDHEVGNIFPGKGKRLARSPRFNQSYDRCMATNNSGGCSEFFMSVEKFLNNTNVIGADCLVSFSEAEDVKKVFTEGYRLMNQLAWRSRTESTIGGDPRVGWLTYSFLNTYCHLRDRYQLFYSDEGVDSLNEIVIADLSKLSSDESQSKPQSQEAGLQQSVSQESSQKMAVNPLPREEIWRQSLLSFNCSTIR